METVRGRTGRRRGSSPRSDPEADSRRPLTQNAGHRARAELESWIAKATGQHRTQVARIVESTGLAGAER